MVNVNVGIVNMPYMDPITDPMGNSIGMYWVAYLSVLPAHLTVTSTRTKPLLKHFSWWSSCKWLQNHNTKLVSFVQSDVACWNNTNLKTNGAEVIQAKIAQHCTIAEKTLENHAEG